ncbi:hypothetical protein TNCV_1152861 [Trichonephila clavipes]|nr:hypothetical protein TNCV_1152861 [Trichonephila clavipes]
MRSGEMFQKPIPCYSGKSWSYVKAVTPNCLGDSPVDRYQLNAHPGSRRYLVDYPEFILRILSFLFSYGRGSRKVKVMDSWPACHEFELVPLKAHHVHRRWIDVYFWASGLKLSPQSLVVITSMWGLAKVGFCILLSGMAVIGWSMESGRRGKRASSGWEMFRVFWHG